ncbi:MAG: dinitrogenase iron-molybdenum cofactor [Planctomycetia bacterium]|nr:dinitrogenase iron-molybdenum cofactor [Planctomycetia bacterium]
MRVAIPVTDGQIPNHLGHCQSFLFADLTDGMVVKEELLPNPGHGPGGPPPAFLARRGVNQILAWGCPPPAREMFDVVGIKILLGATGDAKAALHAWLQGSLKTVKEGHDAGGGCGPSPYDAGRELGGCGGKESH